MGGKDTYLSPGAQWNDSASNLDEPKSRYFPSLHVGPLHSQYLDFSLWDPEAEKPDEPLVLWGLHIWDHTFVFFKAPKPMVIR